MGVQNIILIAKTQNLTEFKICKGIVYKKTVNNKKNI